MASQTPRKQVPASSAVALLDLTSAEFRQKYPESSCLAAFLSVITDKRNWVWVRANETREELLMKACLKLIFPNDATKRKWKDAVRQQMAAKPSDGALQKPPHLLNARACTWQT